MRRILLPVILVIISVVVFSACNKKDAGTSLLDEISGVWRAKNDGAMVSFVYADKKMRMFVGDDPLSVTLGDIDNTNKTVNLNLTTNQGKPGVWTVRQVWDKEHKSFYLAITLHDGTQDELTFVRKISTDDMNRFANFETNKAGAISETIKPTVEQIQSNPSPTTTVPAVQSQSTPEGSWSPSFDCAKVSNGPERLVCSNKELSEADVQLAQVYKTALKNASDKATLKKAQGTWLKNERNACSDAESMLRVYNERIAILKQ